MESRSIEYVLNENLKNREQLWKAILSIQFSVLKVLTALGLPLRESREHDGVYLSILKLMAQFVPILAEQLGSKNKVKYTSKTVYEEQIKILAQKATEKILSMIKDAKFWSVLADSSTDVSQHDQLAIVIRFVEIGSSEAVVHEHFLGYERLKQFNAQGYLDCLSFALFEKYNLNPRFIRAQSYDTTNVMSGEFNGLQKVFRDFLMPQLSLDYVYVRTFLVKCIRQTSHCSIWYTIGLRFR